MNGKINVAEMLVALGPNTLPKSLTDRIARVKEAAADMKWIREHAPGHNIDVTDIVLRAKAEGYREGMVAAAGIVNDKVKLLSAVGCHQTGKAFFETAQTILAAASEPAKVAEVCEWQIEDASEFSALYQSDCGKYKQESLNLAFKFCPFCGKAISVREG